MLKGLEQLMLSAHHRMLLQGTIMLNLVECDWTCEIDNVASSLLFSVILPCHSSTMCSEEVWFKRVTSYTYLNSGS